MGAGGGRTERVPARHGASAALADNSGFGPATATIYRGRVPWQPRTAAGRPAATAPIVVSAFLALFAVAACEGDRAGSSAWPNSATLARRARRAPSRAPAHPDLTATLDALERKDPRQLPAGRVRQHTIEDTQANAAFARAADRLEALGRPLGVAMLRHQPERGWAWTLTVVIYAKGPKKTPVILKLGHDGGDRLGRLTVFDRVPPGPATTNAAYLPINRFVLPVDGTWDVLQGGPTPEQNLHHGHPEQHFALDLVVRDEHGRVRPPEGASLHRASDHYAYGQVVRAPAPGVVVKAVDDRADEAPGSPGTGGGNGVVIDHGFGEFGALWHFAPGSVAVEVGEEVRTGQVLGRVGNSGATTLPHLHWHLSTGHGGMRRVALPIVVDDLVVDGEIRGHHRPRRDERLARSGPVSAAPRGGEQREPAVTTNAGGIWLDL